MVASSLWPQAAPEARVLTTRTCNLLAEYYCCKRIFLQICFSPALDGCTDVKLAAFTVNGKMFTFGRSEEKKGDGSLSDASVQVTGAGGNGFSVRCDLLYPQEMFRVRDKLTKSGVLCKLKLTYFNLMVEHFNLRYVCASAS